MKIKRQRFNVNINIGLKIVLLLGFAAFYLYTILTGEVRQYVHPRIIPYMIFASIVMVMIALLLLGEVFKGENEKSNSWPLLIFIIPLIMAFTLPAKTFDSSTGITGSLGISAGKDGAANTVKSSQKNGQKEMELESTAGTEDLYDESTSDVPDDGIGLQNGVIIMDSSNFYRCLSEIHEHIDKYEGIPIEVVGFVFKDNEDFPENIFVPARLMMVCCAADMVPVGFLCEYEKTQNLETDAWVKVTGVIGKTQFQGDSVPIIKVTDVEKTVKPEYEYVYPYPY